MNTPDPATVRKYVAAVAVPGMAAYAFLTYLFVGRIESVPRMFWLFAPMLFLTELLTIKVPRNSEEDEIATSTSFAFASLLVAGLAPTVVVQGLACAFADVVRGKPFWKVSFNVGQLTIALVAGGLVLHAVTGLPASGAPRFDGLDLAGILLAGAAYLVVNLVLTNTGLALAQGLPVARYVVSDLWFETTTSGVLLALAPIIVAAAIVTPFLIPLTGVPLCAIYMQGRLAVRSRHQALYDFLTGLPNRILLQDRLEHAMVTAKRDGRGLAVMVLDLDRFKDINDTLGHHCGDELLRAVGDRLRKTMRQSDTIARLGGDEFALLLPDAQDERTAVEVARKVLSAFHEPFWIAGLSLAVTPSVGVALYPEHGEEADVLLQRADVAMYVAKTGHAGWKLYTSTFDKNSPTQLAMVAELKRATESDRELLLHFQPKVDITTGETTSVEALVRWQHPALGLIYPDAFIGVAEQTGQIKALTLWVLDSALKQCRAWLDSGMQVGVAVNLSVRNLLDVDLVDDVAEMLARHGVDARWLTLEITETTIMTDSGGSLDVLRRLRSMGVQLSVDDFGTGYSSLSYLKRLPVNEIKIDKSFVIGMAHSESDLIMVRSIIDLGHNLGLNVVAEGVETEAEWNRLSVLGCDVAQGYHVSQPLPAGKIPSWLEARGPVSQAPDLMAELDDAPHLVNPHA